MRELIIKADKPNGIADLVFSPNADDRGILDDLHRNVLRPVDGASRKGDIDDSIVAIRERDFDQVVGWLANYYKSRGFEVEVLAVN